MKKENDNSPTGRRTEHGEAKWQNLKVIYGTLYYKVEES